MIRIIKSIRKDTILLFSIIMLSLGLRIISIGQSFWLDEAAQAIISQNPFQFGHFNGDFQPPLSYYISHIWMQFGNIWNIRSEAFLRIPGVIFGVCSVYVTYLIARHISATEESSKRQQISLFSAFLLATAPYHIYFSQEFRMYSLLTLLTLLVFYSFTIKRYVLMTIFSILLMYTHYFGLFFVITITVLLYVTSSYKRTDAIYYFVFVLLSFLPWLPTLLTQIQTSQELITAWPTWTTISNASFFKFIPLVFAKFTVGMISPEPRSLYILSVALFTLIFLIGSIGATLWFARSFAKKSYRDGFFSILFPFLIPLFLAWFGGLFLSASNHWRIQYILPFIYVFITYFLIRLPDNDYITRFFSKSNVYSFSTFLLIMLVCSNLYFSISYLRNPQNHREDWKSAVTYTDDAVVENRGRIRILAEFTQPFAPMLWYSHRASTGTYSGASTTLYMTKDSVEESLDTQLQEIDTVYVYRYLYELSDPQRLVKQYLLENGFTIQDEKDFHGVGIIEHYTKASSGN